jgi:DNA topoisomerase-3
VAKSGTALSAAERGIYELVARRYVAQFYPPFEYHETKIEVAIEGERFRASGRQTISEGWRAVITPIRADEEHDDADGERPTGALPVLRKGDPIADGEVTISEKQTIPPKRFTEASLIQAMTGIAHYVQDPRIKQLLREADGIGTPATQAAIIQTLFDRRFIEKRGRQIVSTPIGRVLIQVLPDLATRPDMTALWEAAMRRIAEGQMPLAQFLAGVLEQLRKLVDSGRALRVLEVPGAPTATAPPRRGRRRSTSRRTADQPREGSS